MIPILSNVLMEHVMICDYQNIYDYCLNKFSYQYATTPASTSGDITTSVIRTDKDTGEIITISPDSNLYVLPCDNNDIVEVMSVWECYEIYVGNNKIVSQPSLVTLNTIQKEDVIENYDKNLQDGVTIKIDSYNTIILDGKIENQIHLGNVICLANILYNEDANSVMPYILDINNIAYYLNYNTLKSILTKYFQKVSNQKMAKDDLLNQLEIIKTSDDILNKYYCNEKVSKNILKENTVIDYSTYKDVSVLPPGICDPPCDPESCEICVDGSCVSSCGQGECCDNGLCGNCIYGECCVNGQCQETWFFDSSVSTTVNCQPPGYSSDGFDGTTYFWRLQSGPYPTSSAAASAPYGICDRQEFCNFLSVYCGINDCDINGSNYGDGTCTTDRVFECS